MATATPNRVIVYVDGFNLYFGLKAAKLRTSLWLDIAKMAESLLKPGQNLVGVKYFTAMISGRLKLDSPEEGNRSDAKRARQATYVGALRATKTIQIIEGRYQSMPRKCNLCQGHYYRHEEKKTDVNMATAIIHDAMADLYDIAIIVSGDADISPAVEVTKNSLHTNYAS